MVTLYVRIYYVVWGPIQLGGEVKLFIYLFDLTTVLNSLQLR